MYVRHLSSNIYEKELLYWNTTYLSFEIEKLLMERLVMCGLLERMHIIQYFLYSLQNKCVCLDVKSLDIIRKILYEIWRKIPKYKDTKWTYQISSGSRIF